MARTLIIKNADFSVNKVTTVEFEEEVPCTGISLDESTLAITQIGGSGTLTATATPANTTDSVIWSTSASGVATVAGGVVTAVGCGTATITATCGSQTATCAVTVTHVALLTYAINTYLGKDDNKDYLTGGALNNRAIGFIESGTKIISGSTGMSGRHPYVIPNGATKISITAADFKPYCFWLSSTVGSTAQSSVALAYAKDDAGTVPSSFGNRTITIPDRTTGTYQDMDAVAFVFVYNGTISDAAMNNVVVTFTT